MNEGQKLTLTFGWKHLVIALALLNVLTIVLWRPWANFGESDRTISITGNATIEAEPDQFQFNPYWEFTADTQQKAIDEATKKSNTVIKGIKALGIEDKDIKLNSGDSYSWWYDPDDEKNRTNVSVTVTVDSLELAQKVQDYLITTGPQGQITPWPSFSEAKQKELESEARTIAIADAKEKAEQNAKELGFKLGRVMNVSEGMGFGEQSVVGYPGIDVAVDSSDIKETMPIQPGENDYQFSMTVVFAIR